MLTPPPPVVMLVRPVTRQKTLLAKGEDDSILNHGYFIWFPRWKTIKQGEGLLQNKTESGEGGKTYVWMHILKTVLENHLVFQKMIRKYRISFHIFSNQSFLSETVVWTY